MPKVDIINSRTKNSTVVFLFILLMAYKSTIMEKISVFKDQNICQIRLSKEDSRSNDLLFGYLT